MATGFQFKSFFIAHDQCAMKVNTDGILLGAIADVTNSRRLLDLGTGTGLIAIMLAQRAASDAEIIGVELDRIAYLQAQQNVRNSPWAAKIQIQQADIFSLNFAIPFDLIVTNPPYFEHSLASRTPQRDLARTVVKSHFEWLKQAKDWLAPAGKISLILPFIAGEKLIEQAADLELFCLEKWKICTKAGKPPKRVIVTFGLEECPFVEKSLDICDLENQYTAEFKALTRDFYLNF
ncbi:tRNA (adenosine(37)-N6)-methyltransferase TrmM [Pasteurellaceae bacterium Orientalotternb1]|nr:tRNA (adenosine(37)-N6)-methyltransferase TrmM [Pasteurellaceae bacterium Orientalotternb1]